MTDWNLNGTPNALLTHSNPKTMKGEKQGYLTAIMHFSPHKGSGVANVCAFASDGCAAACLNTAGHGGMGLDINGINHVQASRIRRTRFFKEDKESFMLTLYHEITAFVKKASKLNLTPAIRLNGTSDIPWENVRVNGRNIFEMFPTTQFYDYTKYPTELRKNLPENYHLTFSLAENNDQTILDALSDGKNAAVVFDLAKSKDMPSTWVYGGKEYQVVDGDKDDLRFLDPIKGGIVGLRAKGTLATRAAGKASGFVREIA